jgi:carboxymethylenebutenolidase
MEDLTSVLGHVRMIEGANGKVGCAGYCLGGKLAYLMATETDIDASVGYYGVMIETMLDKAEKITHPLLLHIAGDDQFVPPAAQKQIIDRFAGSALVTTHLYEGADHAFARGNGMHYNEAAATLANARTHEFLDGHLKG